MNLKQKCRMEGCKNMATTSIEDGETLELIPCCAECYKELTGCCACGNLLVSEEEQRNCLCKECK